VSALASSSGRYRLLYGGALLLAVAVGAAVAYSDRLSGDNGPYIVLGVLLAGGISAAILLQWRLGAILMAAALPFQTLINFGPVASGMKVLGFLTFISFALALLIDPKLRERFVSLWQQPLTLMLLAFVLWVSTSSLWAIDRGLTLRATITFVGLLGLTIVFGALERRYLVLAWASLAFTAAFSVPAGYILPVPTGSDMADSGRFGPAGAGPNTYSLILVIAFFAAYYGLLGRHRKIAYLVTPVFLYGIFATASRTGLIALIATPLMALLVPRLAARLGWRVLIVYITGALALGVMALAVPSVTQSALGRYTTLSQLGSEDTWTGRWSNWSGALDVIVAHPVLGVGAGNYAQAAVDYSASVQQHSARKAVEKGGELSGVTHDIALGVASELGLVGLALFAGIVFFAFKAALRSAQRSNFATSIFLGLIVAMIGGLSQPWEDEKIVYVLFGSVLALQLYDSAQRGLSSEVQGDFN
jgi:O-antigen ligase